MRQGGISDFFQLCIMDAGIIQMIFIQVLFFFDGTVLSSGGFYMKPAQRHGIEGKTGFDLQIL